MNIPQNSDKISVTHSKQDFKPFHQLLNKLKSLFDRQPQPSPSTQPQASDSADLADQLQANWHYLALVLIVLIIAFLAYSIDWSNDFVNLPETQVAQKPVRQLDISFATTMLILVNFIGLLEAWSRNERLWLDWWIAPLLAGVLIFKDQIPHDPWLIGTSFFTAVFIFAVFQNESQQDQAFWGQIDTTPVVSLAGQLLLVHQIGSIPYPEYIPVWLLWAVFIPALFKELFRTPALAVLTLLMGGIMAFTFNAWIIMICSIIAIVAVTLGASQDWLPTYSKHRTDIPFQVGGRQYSLVIPWDNILGMLYVFAFISSRVYQGNWALFHLQL